MSIEKACRLILKNDPITLGLVADRISCGMSEVPNETRPRIVISLANKQHEHTFTGHAGYTTGRIEINCISDDYTTAKTLADAAIAALDGYEGAVQDAPGVDIQYLTVDSESDIPVVVPAGKSAPDTRGVSVSFNFMILN